MCCVIVCVISAFVYDWLVFFFFKQKTAYEMRISDWSSDVCSSDLECRGATRLRMASSSQRRETRGIHPLFRVRVGYSDNARKAGQLRALTVGDRKSVV